MNQANCSTCEHKQHPDGGWCYMFREEPAETCRIHSDVKFGRQVEMQLQLLLQGEHNPSDALVAATEEYLSRPTGLFVAYDLRRMGWMVNYQTEVFVVSVPVEGPFRTREEAEARLGSRLDVDHERP